MDILIKQAAEEYLNMLCSNLPENCHYTFSKRFERKMKRLIARTLHPVKTSILRIAACIAAAMLLAFGSVIAVDVNAREAFFGWVKEQYTAFTQFAFRGEYGNQDAESFYPGWIPEGYEFYTSLDIQSGRAILYTNENGDFLQLTYSTSPENLEINLFVQGCVEKEVSVNDVPGTLYMPQDKNVSSELVWQNSQGTIFLVSGKCDESVLINVAEKILKK